MAPKSLKWSNPCTNEQLQLLYWTVRATHLAAKDLIEKRRELGLQLGTYQEMSVTGTAIFNVGFSLELVLKLGIAVTENRFPHTHVLVDLYEALPCQTKHVVSAKYDEYSIENPNAHLFQATLWSATRPADPLKFDVRTFRGLLDYLDQMGVYDKRYAFEGFSLGEWFVRVDVEWLAGLIEALMTAVNDVKANLGNIGQASNTC